MLSVCSTIYGSPKSGNAFLRSIFDNASGEEFEVILFLDRASPLEEQTLLSGVPSSPRLRFCYGSKDGVLTYNRMRSHLWEQVYGKEITEYALKQLLRYEQSKNMRLWSQYARGLNRAVEEAKGDFILLTPGDFVALFDAHNLNYVVTQHADEHRGRFFGHLSLVAPLGEETWFHDVFTGWRMNKEYAEVLAHLMRWHAKRDDYPITPGVDRYWPFNHGIRVVDKETFREVGGLVDWFLSKPGPTDIFNRLARACAYGREAAPVRRSVHDLTGYHARMAVVPFDEDDLAMEYLYKNPCDGEVVGTLQCAEEKWMKEHNSEYRSLFK